LGGRALLAFDPRLGLCARLGPLSKLRFGLDNRLGLCAGLDDGSGGLAAFGVLRAEEDLVQRSAGVLER
jgi:hypothetical protein